MNLLVEKCDCTITATYKDAEGAQYDVQVLGADGKSVYSHSMFLKIQALTLLLLLLLHLIQYLTIGKQMTKTLLRTLILDQLRLM
mgnify:CR=1 FL=1